MSSLKHKAQIDFKNQKWEASILKFVEYLQEHPDSSSSWLNIAAAYYNMDQLDSALENIQYAEEVDPEWHLIYLYKAQIYAALKRFDDARKSIKICKDILIKYKVI